MIKIPAENNLYRVQSESDLVPNISSVYNMNFDETGYIKLSPPMITVVNNDDYAGFRNIGDVFNYNNEEYKVITDDLIYDFNLNDVTTALDASAPDGDDDCRVAGYNTDSFLLGTGGSIWEYDDPTWTERNTQGITFLTEFPSRVTWVGVINGNDVNQYATAELDDAPVSTTSTGPDLELPQQFSITGLAYSNYQIGIATRHKSNLNAAMFFVWDGTSTDASIGVPVDAPEILDVVAYKSSWVVLTSKGQLLHFIGAGWEELGILAPYYQDATWIDTTNNPDHGRLLAVDGDRIYVNIGSKVDGDRYDTGILDRFPSGIWCFDPKIGLYHRHGLASSKIIVDSPSLVDDVYTASVTTNLVAGDIVIDKSDPHKQYFAIPLTATTFSLATSYANATADTPVTTTEAGSGSKEWVDRFDWSQLNYPNEFGFVKQFDNAFASTDGRVALFAGMDAPQTTVASNVESMTVPCINFTNIGAIEYYKMKSSQKTEMWKEIIVKYKPLTEADKIRIKYKVKDSFKQKSIGEAYDKTPDRFITWVDSTSFTFNEAYFDGSNLEVGDEVTFQSGTGAGSSAHIVSTSLSVNTWTVVVDEEIRGAVASNTSTCSFDTYQLLGTINATQSEFDGGTSTFRLDKNSKWLQVKLEVIGHDIAIEELIVNNLNNEPVDARTE
jgi:hypothetical protein